MILKSVFEKDRININMSRIKTYPITPQQLDDLMKALNLTRDDIPRVCQGVSPSAYGWWRNQGQVPYVHLRSFGKELQRQLKLRPKSKLDEKIEKELEVLFLLDNALDSVIPISNEPIKTIAQILKTTKKGDILRAGRRKWIVGNKFDGHFVASPANNLTTFELWSCGVESVACIPNLRIYKN